MEQAGWRSHKKLGLRAALGWMRRFLTNVTPGFLVLRTRLVPIRATLGFLYTVVGSVCQSDGKTLVVGIVVDRWAI